VRGVPRGTDVVSAALLAWGPATSIATSAYAPASAVGVTAAGESSGIFTIDGVPYWVIYAAAFAIVFARAQATYWVGRGVARGTGNTRWAQRLDGARAQRAVATINRWGPIAVTLSFFTVGVQTVINLTAGYTRMRFSRYLAALLPGCAIWAAIWTTVGIATFNAAVLLAASSPVGLAALVLLVVALVTWIVVASRRRRQARVSQGGDEPGARATPSGTVAPAGGPDATTGSNPFGDVADLLLDAQDDAPGPGGAGRTESGQPRTRPGSERG